MPSNPPERPHGRPQGTHGSCPSKKPHQWAKGEEKKMARHFLMCHLIALERWHTANTVPLTRVHARPQSVKRKCPGRARHYGVGCNPADHCFYDCRPDSVPLSECGC